MAGGRTHGTRASSHLHVHDRGSIWRHDQPQSGSVAATLSIHAYCITMLCFLLAHVCNTRAEATDVTSGIIVANTPTASAFAPTFINLEWEASSGDNSSISYRVYSSLPDGSSETSLLAGAGDTSIVFDNLASGTMCDHSTLPGTAPAVPGHSFA